MASLVLTRTRIGEWSWVVSWQTEPAESVVRVFVDGLLFVTTTLSSWQFDVMPGEQLTVEVLDDDADEPAPAFPGRAVLQWDAWVEGAAAPAFAIEQSEDNGESWERLSRVNWDGYAQMQWPTPFLSDQVEHLFRVVGIGSDENEGPGVEIRVPMIRHPDVAGSDGIYDAETGLLEFTS